MRYFIAQLEEQSREREYRNYVTDALKGAFGLNIRYADIWTQETETRSAEDIKASIVSKLRELEVSNGSIQSSGEIEP